MVIKLKWLISMYRMITNKNYSTLAGAISFFIIVNGGSLLYLIIVSLNYFNYDLNIDFGSDLVSKVLKYVYDTSKAFSHSYSIFFIITSMWSSSTLFYHLLRSSELIYNKKKIPFFVKL